MLGQKPAPARLTEISGRKEEQFRQLVRGRVQPLPGVRTWLERQKAAGLIDVPPGRCVIVEDAVAGVEAARRAGMRCVAVTITNPARALREADVVVERLIESSPGHLSPNA